MRQTHISPTLGAATTNEPEASPPEPTYDPAAREMHSSSATGAGEATIAGPEASAQPPPYSPAFKTRASPALDTATIAGPKMPADCASSSSALSSDSSESPRPASGSGSCNVCGKQASSMPEGKLLTCSRCSSVFYCSAACQQKHWPLHREHCRAV